MCHTQPIKGKMAFDGGDLIGVAAVAAAAGARCRHGTLTEGQPSIAPARCYGKWKGRILEPKRTVALIIILNWPTSNSKSIKIILELLFS